MRVQAELGGHRAADQGPQVGPPEPEEAGTQVLWSLRRNGAPLANF